MKNTILILTALFAFGTFINAQENYPILLKVKQGEQPNTMIVQAANLPTGGATISVRDLDGYTAFVDEVEGVPGYHKALNLEGVPAGHYIVAVRSGSNLVLIGFALNGERIAFYQSPTEKEENRFAQLVSRGATSAEGDIITHIEEGADEGLSLRVANLKGKPTQISLMDPYGQVVFCEFVKKEAGYAVNLKLEGMEEGMYYLFIEGYDAGVIQTFAYTDGDLRLMESQRLDYPRHPPSTRIAL